MSIIDANAIVDFLANVIADSQRSPEDKDRGAKALEFYAVKEDEANAGTLKFEAANAEAVQAGQPESSPETLERTRKALLDYGREGAKMLWYTPDDCIYSSFTGTDGVVRQTLKSKRFGGLRPDEFYENIPDSGPAPQFGTSKADDVIPDVPVFVQPTFGLPEFVPSVPLPICSPTNTEQLARKEAFQSLDDRFSPAAVQERVRKIEEEAERVFGPRPVIVTDPIPPSAEEQKAIAGCRIELPTDSKIEQIKQADAVRPLTTVESIEARINEERDVRARYDAAQRIWPV